jgi:hypothetical protein
VAWSAIVAGSNTTMSAWQPTARQPRSRSFQLLAGKPVSRWIASGSGISFWSRT